MELAFYHSLKSYKLVMSTQAWYADDAAAAGSTANIRCWWDMITKAGPMFGYYPNALKTHLIVKQEYVQLAKDLFEGSGIKVILMVIDTLVLP